MASASARLGLRLALMRQQQQGRSGFVSALAAKASDSFGLQAVSGGRSDGTAASGPQQVATKRSFTSSAGEGPPSAPPPGGLAPVYKGDSGGTGPTVTIAGAPLATNASGVATTAFGISSPAAQQPSTPKEPRKQLSAEDFTAEKLKDLGIGGLDSEMESLFRRVFASRMMPPGVAARMGIPHVKGVLMYGPPGTGKTLVARRVGRLLAGDREPQVVNGPELLQRWVGQSEANIRMLFEAAENEYAREGENADLFVIIFDEIDALCKARGNDSNGSTVGDSVVNQLLTKLDGVESAPNVLVIGLTNRRDLLDQALLRPGRLEVQMEVGLPDAEGREQILQIHTKKMADNDMLASDVDLSALASATRNYSGAELAGLVRAAASHAYHRVLNPGGHDSPETHGRHGRGLGMAKVELTQADFEASLSEITPALGSAGAYGSINAFQRWVPFGMLPLGPQFEDLVAACKGLVGQVKAGTAGSPVHTALLEGPPGTGKTALAATIAAESDFPFTRVVCAADTMVGMSSTQRCEALQKAFDDALASPLSCLVLDNLERILGFSRVGPVYSNEVLQTLLLLLRRRPPDGRRLLVIATTSSVDVMQALELSSAFNVTLHVAPLTRLSDKTAVLQAMTGLSPTDAVDAAKLLPGEVPIKHLLSTMEMASAAERFSAIMSGTGPSASGEGEEQRPSTLAVSLAGLKSYLSSLSNLSTPAGQDRQGGNNAASSGDY